MTTDAGKRRGNATVMMTRERRRWMRRVVGVIAVTVRDRSRDVFVLFVSFLVRLVTIGLLGSRSSRATTRKRTTTVDARASESSD